MDADASLVLAARNYKPENRFLGRVDLHVPTPPQALRVLVSPPQQFASNGIFPEPPGLPYSKPHPRALAYQLGRDR